MTDKNTMPSFGKIIQGTEESKNNFNKVFSTFREKTDGNYLLYILQNLKTNETMILSSNPAWGEIFLKNDLLYECKLVKFAGKYFREHGSGSLITIWNDIPASSKMEKTIDGMRTEFNIANGLCYTHQYTNIREAITLAADPKYKDFHRQFFKNHIISDTIKSLRGIANQKNKNDPTAVKQGL